MPEIERTITSVLIGMARTQEAFTKKAFKLQGDRDWSDVKWPSFGASEFNLGSPDPNARLTLQGVLGGHPSDGRDVEWQLDVLRSGDLGWVVERAMYTWTPQAEAPVRTDLPGVECPDSLDLASRLPSLAEELLMLEPTALTE